MKMFDGHCDVLYKMWDQRDRSLFFDFQDRLDSSYARLLEGGVKVQTMAVYIPPEYPKELRHYAAFQMIDMLHDVILAHDKIELLTSKEQLDLISDEDNKLYILLSLEGAEPLHGDLTYLRTFYQLGVRSIGLTWNYRNEAADGVREPNPSGLSAFGRELIQEMNRHSMAVDISHLSEKGFWDCIELSKQPIMASHCNARALCDHPRNLYDEQIKAIYNQQGLIGITFVPYFLDKELPVPIKKVLDHVEYMLSLGGENYIGFGSDFDGITDTVINLEHSGKVVSFIEELQRHYSETVVEKLVFHNWKNYYQRIW